MLIEREAIDNWDPSEPRTNGRPAGSGLDIVSLSKIGIDVNVKEIEDSTVNNLTMAMTQNQFKVRVMNLKSGIITPLTDYFNFRFQQQDSVETQRHKESILYSADLKRTIERVNARSDFALVNSFRETYYGLTKSITSAIGTVITPVLKGIGFVLFGTKDKGKTVVQAIEEQTQFLRTGKIFESSNMFSRFMRRGLVGSAVAGAADLVGLGRQAAQRAERKRAAGEDRTIRENIVTQMGIWWGTFGDIEKFDTRRNFAPDSSEFRQESLLDRIRLSSEAFLEFFRDYSGKMFDEVRMININLANYLKKSPDTSEAANEENYEVEEKLFSRVTQAIHQANDSSIVAMAAGYDNIVRNDNENMRESIRMSSFDNFRNSQILRNINEEMKQTNSPVLTPFENRMLESSNAQYEQLLEANELARIREERRKESIEGSGGLLGAITGLLSGAAGPLASLGKKFIITPIMGAIKAGGAWIAKNGFKVLLRAPFAKVFAVGMVSKLLYDHILRPTVSWFDNTFDTEIGAKLDSITGWFSEKFGNMVDWIKEKLQGVPVIGRLFKEDNVSVPEVEEPAKRKEDSVSAVDTAKNFGKWYGKQFTEMVRTGSTALGGILDRGRGFVRDWFSSDESNVNGVVKRPSSSDVFSFARDTANRAYSGITTAAKNTLKISQAFVGELSDSIPKAIEEGIDRLRGYDYDAFEKMRALGLSPLSIADSAMSSVINPLSPNTSDLVSEQMVLAASESKRMAFEQVELMKRQREEAAAFNRRFLEVMQAVAGNTEATAGATMAGVRATTEMQRRKDTLDVPKDM